jgi:sugar/nucleoside kinase (ribokinase family)
MPVGDLRIVGRELFNTMNVTRLLIHPIDRCILVEGRDVFEFHGMVVRDPILSTGAGDNLNAGYCFGLQAGFPIHMSVLLGIAASGAYVQYGKSPDRTALLKYVDEWIAAASSDPAPIAMHATM